ncbi:MAG: transposase [Oscillospiraceae bacterium]|jgi:REP element-mobilizing transposase RayT|nr:transposase [Oscillospiraceae bacterium]
MHNGVYFITVCVKDKHPMLGKILQGEMALSEHGQLVQRCIEHIETAYPSVALDCYVIMPNHVHLLLHFMDFQHNPQPSRVVLQLKSAVTKAIKFSLWQDGAYISAITTAKYLHTARRYVQANPKRWQTDKFYV